ncbi:outer membrane beta-barrel protein [Gynurincola endophyticus]|uniref:outer membrane beta-barrel protein n=1 Tax=Gynurincola endophyticus TaxID=2479004 RepID=UPI000F8E02AE|nr:outer membrane beta-barrel protein [Gynurincola endophyticus]
MKIFTLLAVMLITVTGIYATDTVHIKVMNEDQLLIQEVNITIRSPQGHLLLNDVIKTGTYSWVKPASGVVIIFLSHIEYETHQSEPVILEKNKSQQLEYILIKKKNLLDEVVVQALPRVAVQLADRLVINIAANPNNTGASTLDVLEKSPGIGFDKDGNFTLKGKNNVLVLIDDKPTYMNGEALKQFLANIPASDVKQIEFLDNPPAKYDAAGNAGAINIVTTKKTNQGWNGLINLSYLYSNFHKSFNNIQLNYGAEKLSLQFGYRQQYNESETSLYGLREFFEADGKTIKAYLNQPTMFYNFTNNHQWTTGLDYRITKKSTVNFNFIGTINRRNNPNEGPAEWMDANKKIDSIVYVRSYFENDWHSLISNLGYQWSISDKKKLSVDLSLLNYRFTDNNLFSHRPWGSSDIIPFSNGYLPLMQDIYVAKTDYSVKTSSGWNLEMGAKYSRIKTNNNAIYHAYTNNGWIEDSTRTNKFVYNEKIYAAYVSTDKKIADWTIKAGLRFEHTNYEAQTFPLKGNDSTFNRKYTNLFPSLYLQRALSDDRSIGLSVSRRIDRPPFSFLNPFIFDVNKYTTVEGNPYILPQFTWNIEANYMPLEGIITSIGYSITNDYFSQLFYSKDDKQAVYTRGNVGKLHQYSFNLSYIKAIRNWWNIVFQSNLIYKDFKGFSWTNYEVSRLQWQGSLTQQFKIFKKLNAEIAGNYITKHQMDLQEVLFPTGQVGISITRNILKDKATIKIGARDLFYTQAMEGYTYFQYFGEYFKVQRDSRMVTFNFSYRFGKKVKEVKSRSGSLSDELQRAGI